MIVSCIYFSSGKNFLFSARWSAGLLWKTPCNLIIGSHRESVWRSRWGSSAYWWRSYTQRVCIQTFLDNSKFISIRHTGPVWQVARAHPKYGHILASCSYDGKVLIWKEQRGQGVGTGGWAKIKEHTLNTASGRYYLPRNLACCLQHAEFNSVSLAPHELGAILACASSDGKISVLTFKSMIPKVSLGRSTA